MLPEHVRVGVREWSKAAFQHDWINQRRWWTRLVNWYSWKYKDVYLDWHDEDELAASIIGYIEHENHKRTEPKVSL